MAMNGTALLHVGGLSTRNALLISLLLVVLVAAFVLAANTPWVLDQPMPPYDWAISL